MHPKELETAIHHLARSRLLLEEQRKLVAKLPDNTEAAWIAAQILTRLEELSASFERHVRLLEEEALEQT